MRAVNTQATSNTGIGRQAQKETAMDSYNIDSSTYFWIWHNSVHVFLQIHQSCIQWDKQVGTL